MKASGHDITVGIIGAGFSGVMTAANLVRLWPSATGAAVGRGPARRIVLIERDAPARGPAYSTTEPHHLLNVPAARMGAWADNPRDFLDWCSANETGISAADFAPRAMYARYIDAILAETLAVARASGIGVEIIRAAAERVEPTGQRFRVTLAGAHPALECDALALCTGNMEPSLASGGPGSTQSGAIIPNPWAPGALQRVERSHRVAIVGSGLTMLDVLWSLEARAHTGPVTIISRHAMMPRRHRDDPIDAAPVPADVLASPDIASPVQALRWVRAKIDEVERAPAATGKSELAWTFVIDSLRPHTARAWGGWNTGQRRQFVRHLRALWDVHRHRVAPLVLGVVERLRQEGRLTTLAASVRQIQDGASEATILLAPRGAGAPDRIVADRVITCTGPNPDLRKATDPMLAALVRDGLLVPDEVGLGARCDSGGVAIRAAGAAAVEGPPIHVVGPLRRADLWESIAVPELRVQAAEAAKRISASLATR